MPTFLLVAFSIYGAMNAYALHALWAAIAHSRLAIAALVLAGAVLTASPLLVWFLERRGMAGAPAVAWIAYAWMGYLFLFLCVGLALDLAHGAAALLRVPWPLGPGVRLAAVALAALALAAYSVLEARGLEVDKVTIATPKLASGRVTVAQISDLHLGTVRANGVLGRVMGELEALRPDIVVATGDIVDGRDVDWTALAQAFRTYRPPLGAYAVTGNHEYITGLDTSLAILRASGFTVLRGESVRAGPLVIAGVDDRGAVTPPPHGGLAPGSPAPGGDHFVVLLKHQPVVNGEPAFDLQLSGHVHGGQIFPFGLLTRLAYHVGTGLTRLADGRWLYVSRGAGTWGPPMRLFAPPEITLFTIEAEPKG